MKWAGGAECVREMKTTFTTVVKVLCYKSEGRWFDFRWCHWNFSLTYSYGPGVNSPCNRNEYQEHFLGAKAACA